MANIKKRVLYIGFALTALGASVIAVNVDRTPRQVMPTRPVAVSPEVEAPTPVELELRSHAIAQPIGVRNAEERPSVPMIARPQR